MSTIHTTLDQAPEALCRLAESLSGQVCRELESRGVRAANELHTAANHVLRGQRHGRRYKLPGTYGGRKRRRGVYYTASAPGEPPAVRTGAFRLGWKAQSYAEDRADGGVSVHSMVENGQRAGRHLLGAMLEQGTARMAPRPYQQQVLDRALPRVRKIYKEPYCKD